MDHLISRTPARAVGTRIRELRDMLGISQTELAELATVHSSNLGRIERGQSAASVDTLALIASALGTSVSDLTMYVTAPPVTSLRVQ